MQQKRTYSIAARLTHKEYQTFLKHLEKSGYSGSEYIRACVLHKKIRAVPIGSVEELKQLTKQVLRLGNNLNQIARGIHQNGTYPQLKEMQRIYDEFMKIKHILAEMEANIKCLSSS